MFVICVGWVTAIAACAQKVAVKSNVLYDLTTTINVGVEYALSDRWTIEVSGNYNPWMFTQTIKNGDGTVLERYDGMLRHWMVQPEVRRWLRHTFDGHFVGLHALAGQYNCGGLGILPNGWADGRQGTDGLQHKRFEGWMAGAGAAYGYLLKLKGRLWLELSIGAGYLYLDYDKYSPRESKPREDSRYAHYFGLTKVGVSAVFLLKQSSRRNHTTPRLGFSN